MEIIGTYEINGKTEVLTVTKNHRTWTAKAPYANRDFATRNRAVKFLKSICEKINVNWK